MWRWNSALTSSMLAAVIVPSAFAEVLLLEMVSVMPLLLLLLLLLLAPPLRPLLPLAEGELPVKEKL